MTRYVTLFCVAACGPQWTQKATVEPASDSTHETTIEIPSRKNAAPLDPHTMSGAVVIPHGSQVCPPTPNATLASIRLTFVNQTTYQHDLCAAVDRMLGKLADLNALVRAAFRLNVSLEWIRTSKQHIQGSVGMRLQALSGDVGTAFAWSFVPDRRGPLGHSITVTDAIDDAIEDLISNTVGPTMTRLAPRQAAP